MSDSELVVVAPQNFPAPILIERAGPSTRKKFFEFFTVPILRPAGASCSVRTRVVSHLNAEATQLAMGGIYFLHREISQCKHDSESPI
jgi:hypothetical protein